ncbi:SARP family transcriptional regulator [Lentzea sp. NBRC 105346]|uniref:GNAT family N-acetyltransferase n=1 Tax=Lentzea sp. NBRC 105346 TaxID=3032205 RepID=UPI0024A45500|nr:GNAT family N-acetyltransferase [Lentzea sp. NBRC 105346]GLZ28319.1 SARP family transcriptional regulator [Lentzea sp. NBRC 105346]
MWFGLLGPVQARLADGTLVPIGAPRLRALLAMLVLDAGTVVSHSRLIDGLYGDDVPANASNALQSQVSRLRRLLPSLVVEHSVAGYRIPAASVDIAECRAALSNGRVAEALSLWRGSALSDVDAPFVADARAQLEELRLSVLMAFGDVERLTEAVREHPLHEPLRAALMRALALAGRSAEALEVFFEARRLLADELGVDPSPVLAAAHLEVLRGSQRRLPAQLTSFVGRADDVRRVGKWLGESRLVTLIGPGGAGKTRLAIETAGQEPDDVFFVDLGVVNGPLTRPTVAPEATSGVPQRGSAGGGPGAVARAVLSAVGVREAGLLSPGGPVDPMDRLVAALADRPVLLVVDNCEHVVAEAATVVDALLAACLNLRVLATSREALGITGETLCPVPPLEPAPAVRLFTDRAVAVRPDVVLDAGVVERICAALDGMPLAIELAAARVRSLPLTEIAARLDDRFALLSRGSRTAAPRHRTLQAVVEWSWDLLTPAEQRLAARLTVFTGGASLDAIAAVCGSSDVDALVEKSFVEFTGDRYRMLDTIRAFCATQETGISDETDRTHHARYFLDLAREAEPHLRRGEQLEWLRRLAADHDNLTAAVRWAIGHDHRLALELIAALTTYWWFRGLRTEAARLADEFLRATGEKPLPGMEVEYAMALLIAWPVAVGDQRARRALTERLTGAMVAPPRYPIMTMIWGMATGAPTGVGEDQMERRYELLGDDPWSLALADLGAGLQEQNPVAAQRKLADGVERFRAIGDRWGASLGLSQLAEIALREGRPREAIAKADEARELMEQLDAAEDLADLLCTRARAAAALGEDADFDTAVRLARRAGANASLANIHLAMAEVALGRGELGAARELCDLAWSECPSGWYGPEQTRLYIQLTRARITDDRVMFTDALSRARALRDHVAIKAMSGRVVELDLTDDEVAARVHRIQLAAYRIEAGLIGNDNIPPLHESLDEMCAQPLTWIGVTGDDGLPVAFLAYDGTDIDRLCVDPAHFRRGHARALVTAVPHATTVATGALNTPAITLYERLGFERAGTIEPEPGLLIATFTRPAPATTATAAAGDAG